MSPDSRHPKSRAGAAHHQEPSRESRQIRLGIFREPWRRASPASRQSFARLTIVRTEAGGHLPGHADRDRLAVSLSLNNVLHLRC